MSGNKYEPSRSKYDPILGHGPGAVERRLRAKHRLDKRDSVGFRPVVISDKDAEWLESQQGVDE